MRRFRSFSAVFALSAALILAGCGSDKPSATGSDGKSSGKSAGAVDIPAAAKPYVEALKDSVSGDEEGEIHLTPPQKECLASRFVQIIGHERFADAGITPADLAKENGMDFSTMNLSPADGNKLYDSFEACGIDVRKELLSSMAEGGMTDDVEKCLGEVFTDDSLRKFMVASMILGEAAMEEDPTVAPIFGGLMACVFVGMGES